LTGLVILILYVDSYFFVLSTGILQLGVGVFENMSSCQYLTSVLSRYVPNIH
jgi:hypothetical protein